jgi:hypothetical protein
MEPALKIFEAFIIAFSVVLCIGWGVLALCWAFPQLLGDIPDQYAGVPSGRDGTSAAQKSPVTTVTVRFPSARYRARRWDES